MLQGLLHADPDFYYTCIALYSPRIIVPGLAARRFLLLIYSLFCSCYQKCYQKCYLAVTGKKQKAGNPHNYGISGTHKAGDERIELPPKVLETPIIPFDQSPTAVFQTT